MPLQNQSSTEINSQSFREPGVPSTSQFRNALDSSFSSNSKRYIKDGVEKIIEQARQSSAGLSCQDAVESALHYFVSNVERMQYGTFRKQGYFIGSGVIEAGCKTVVGSRCKQSGMFWSQTGVENILALRCIKRSRSWEQFWKCRADHHSARNNTLPFAA